MCIWLQPGYPYDGNTLVEAWEKAEILTDQRPAPVVVDRCEDVEKPVL